jgi:hypothetical protein
VEAAFQEAGAEFLARPAPGSPLLAARVPAAALPSLVKRLQALGGLRTLQPLPEGGRAPDVLVTLGW